MKLLKTRVAAKKIITTQEVKLGSIIVNNESHRDDRYSVVATGPDVKDVMRGDIVRILPTAKSELAPYAGEILRFLDESEIYAMEV